MCIRDSGIPWRVLGNGSNLLVSDRGIEGVVIAMEGNWCHAGAEGNLIRAGAGELLARVARVALEHGLTGMEFAAGIPGSEMCIRDRPCVTGDIPMGRPRWRW